MVSTRLMFVGILAAGLWAQQPALPVKGFVQGASADAKGNRTAQVVLKVYNQEFGGQALFQETQTVQLEQDGFFFTMVGAASKGGVPDRITSQNNNLWIEYSTPNVAFINGANQRQQVTLRRDTTNDVGTNAYVYVYTSTTLCYSCGGSWPVFQGSFVSYGNNPSERGSLCAGAPAVRTDYRPYLCGRD